MSSGARVSERSSGGRGSTRRGFVAGLAAGGAAHVAGGPLLARVATAQTPKPCAPSPPGIRTSALAVAPGGRTIWTADAAATTITAHRRGDFLRIRSIDVGRSPLDIAVSPDGENALVTTAFFDRPGLALVDLGSGSVDHLDVGPEPREVAYMANGRTAWVAGGGRESTLTRVEPRTGTVHEPIVLGAHARGLALLPGGEHALVALNGESAVAVVSLKRGVVVRRIRTPPFPAAIAVSADGRHGVVTHNGFREERVTPLDLVRRRARAPVATGLDPAGVAFTGAGSLALVANAGAGTLWLVDARTGRRRRRFKVGGAPRFVAPYGRRALFADGASGQVTAIRVGLA